jgi:hypothetical protein
MPGGNAGGQQIDIMSIINWGPAVNYQSLNMVLWASNETDHCIYRHFALNPGIAVNYISTPNVPANLVAKNGTAPYPCSTASPGPWIGAASANSVTLNDSVSSPDAGDRLTAHFYLSANGAAATDTAVAATESNANTPIPATATVTLTNNTSYAWSATASNSVRTSPGSPTCYFRYDNGAPSAPVVTSTAYPINGPTTVPVGGSGAISWSASDALSGVTAYNYNLNGSSISSGGGGQHQTTATSLSIPLSSLSYGTNTLWVQAVDAAGNLSQPQPYNFFVQQSAFGQYQPGVAGDLDADGIPDLVSIDAAGSVHLFSNPEIISVNPTGDLTQDPLQYGGRMIIPATSNARWPMPDSASAAGALLAHAGSFTGNNYDDLVVAQNGHLAVAANPGPTGTWTFKATDITKPPCASCLDYNGQDWSSVIQVVGIPRGAGLAPQLLTVEYVNGKATVWLYTAVSGSFAYQPPVLISGYTNSWHWDDMQIIGAGQLPGSSGTTLWIRRLDGELFQIHNIEAGVPDPGSVRTQIASGFTAAAYPLMTTFGRADTAGNVALWVTDAAGTLKLVPTSTTSTGVTTVGGMRPRSAPGWGTHELAVGGSYTPYNNSAVGFENTSNGIFDLTTDNGSAYAGGGLRDAHLAPGTVVNDGSGGCPTGWTTCTGGLSTGNTIFVARGGDQYDSFRLPGPWAHRSDNYVAAGQTLAVPTPNTSGPAHTISFLGAASTRDNVNGASVNATLTYTNGHTQVVPITFADWTHDVATGPIGGTIAVARTTYRITASTGAVDPTATYVFATPDLILLDNGNPPAGGVQIASVTLASNSAVHVFSIAVA